MWRYKAYRLTSKVAGSPEATESTMELGKASATAPKSAKPKSTGRSSIFKSKRLGSKKGDNSVRRSELSGGRQVRDVCGGKLEKQSKEADARKLSKEAVAPLSACIGFSHGEVNESD